MSSPDLPVSLIHSFFYSSNYTQPVCTKLCLLFSRSVVLELETQRLDRLAPPTGESLYRSPALSGGQFPPREKSGPLDVGAWCEAVYGVTQSRTRLKRLSSSSSSSRGWRRRRQWHPTPVFLPGKSHVPQSLVGCSPWGR